MLDQVQHDWILMERNIAGYVSKTMGKMSQKSIQSTENKDNNIRNNAIITLLYELTTLNAQHFKTASYKDYTPLFLKIILVIVQKEKLFHSSFCNARLQNNYFCSMKNTSNKKPHSRNNPLTFNVVQPDELMAFIMKKMDGISRNKVKNMLSNGYVSVDGERKSQYNFSLQPGMKVEIGKPTAKERFHSPWLDIVFEDRSIVVINKKEGLLSSSPTVSHTTAQSILNDYFIYTQQRCRAHVVHRLDRNTSGLMLFAKDKNIAMDFENDWKEKVYDRRYVAVVSGTVDPRSGTVQSWLKESNAFVTLSCPTDNGGKLAITHYEVLVSNRNYSLLDLKLDTGRKNQIRIHMQDIGHPVVGDAKFGSKDDAFGRLCLHAYRLCFIHPVTKKELEFETPFPAVFEKAFPQ